MAGKKQDTVLVFLIAYVGDAEDINMEEGLEKLRERGAARMIDVKVADTPENGWDDLAKSTADEIKRRLESSHIATDEPNRKQNW